MKAQVTKREKKKSMWIATTLALLFLVISSLFAEEVKPKDRYFFSGNGSIHLINVNTGKAAQVQYRLLDGSYPAEVRRQVDELFGVPNGSSDHISLRLVSVLD